MSLKMKIQSFVHLCSNIAYPFILIAAILNLPLVLIKEGGEYDPVFKFMSIFIFAFMSSFMFYLYSQKDVYEDWQKRMIMFPVFMTGSMGFSVNNTKAVIEGLINKKSEFVRTPKFKITDDKHTWTDKKYLTKKIPFTTYIEAVLSLYCFVGVAMATYYVQIASLPFQLMFAIGFGLIAYLSIKQVVVYNRAIKSKRI